ncbi:MAG: hypothetical protein WC444_00360 [Candidatus Paceibacterota bacterium]
MTEINPHKILIGIRAEQIKNGDPDFIVNLLTDFEKDDTEKIKSLRGSVSLMFPKVSEYPFAFLMWSMGLYTKYPNFAYFLDKESGDFIVESMLYDMKSPPADKGKLLNNLYSKAVDFGIKYGYSKEEMATYFSH